MLRLGIIGLGWLGTRLAQSIGANATIYTTTRSHTNQQQHAALGYHSTLVDFDTESKIEPWGFLHQLDIIVITIPLSTRKHNSNRISNLLSFIEGFKGQVICCSSTGIYPNEPKTYIEKDIDPLNVPTEAPFVRDLPQSNILRLGGLMGYDRYLSKYNITTGLDDAVNHIHVDDVINVIKILIQHQTHREILNIVAPLHPTKSAILAQERGESFSKTNHKASRIINSDLLINNFLYTFTHPNPLYFNR